jgi:conjugal transfer pilus assembly protein TraI
MGFLKWLLPSRAVPAAAVQKVNPKQIDFEVPRYPPFMKGLPVIGPEALLQSQKELLDRLALVVNVNKTQYAQLYLGILERFAAYVHLLPASQSHHHRGAGGLLRHSIEVALGTVYRADKLLINLGKTPEQRRTIEPRWQLTAFVAGLCHDLGKPASDMVVSGPDRANVWDPIDESLSEWATANDVSAYFIDWREGRGKQHLALSTLLATKIIGREAMSWISQGSKELVVWLTETLNENPSARNPLCELVKLADQSSVERDMKSMGVAMAGYELGVPVERHLTDIMRRLIKEGTWRINEAGARIFKIEDATFLVWPSGGDEIARQVREDGVPGLPRTADGILDMLTERDLARLRESAETPEDRFWRIAPDVLSAKIPKISLSCIRLRDDALISTLPIASIPGKVLNDGPKEVDEDHEQDDGSESDSAQAQPGATEVVESAIQNHTQASQEAVPQAPARKIKSANPAVPAPEATQISANAKVPPKMVVDPASGEILAMEVTKADGSVQKVEMRSGEPKGAGKKSLSSPKGIRPKTHADQERADAASPPGATAELSEGALHVEAKGGAGPQAPIREVSGEPANGSGKAVKSKGKKGIDISQPPTMEFDGALGMLLLAIIDDIKTGAKQWNKDVRVDREEMVYLRWPQSFAGYGLTPKTILDEGKSKDWFWIDPYMPMTPVVDAEFEGQQVKAVRLNLEPSYTFLHRSGYGGDQMPKAVKAPVDADAMEARQQESVSTVAQQFVSEQPEYEPIHEEPPAYLNEVPPFTPDLADATCHESSYDLAIQQNQGARPMDRESSKAKLQNTEPASDALHPSTAPSAKNGASTQLGLELAEADSQDLSGSAKASAKTPRLPDQQMQRSSDAAGKGLPAPGIAGAAPKSNPIVEVKDKSKSTLSTADRFEKFMSIVGAMEGSMDDKGWKQFKRAECLSQCKAQGLQVHMNEFHHFVSSSPERLAIKGLMVFYKPR